MSPETIRHHVSNLQFARTLTPKDAVMGFAQLNPDVDDNFGPVLVCSCGMTELGLPEIILTGRNEENLSIILGMFISAVCENGLVIEDGKVFDDMATVRIQAHKLTQHQARIPAVVCTEYYKAMNKWPEFIQLAGADPQNILPGEPGYDAEYMYKYGQREYWNK